MTSYLIVLVIIIVLMLREKEIRPSRMWVTPALFVWLTFSSITQSANLTPRSLLLYLICLFVGLGFGIWRGKLEKVRFHPVSGKLTSKSSIAGVVIFMGVMLLRLLAGYWGKEHVLSISNALLFIPLENL
jgi:hypothetical protein